MRRATLLLLFAVACDAPRKAPPLPGPVARPRDDLIERLGATAIEEREAAADALFATGNTALPSLREAASRATDPEVRARARDVVDALDALRFFPMRRGHRWVYASEAGDVTFTVLDTTMVSGVKCFAVRRRIGGTGLNFYLSVTRAGVRIHRVGGDDFTPPYLEIAFPLREGASWEWSGSIGARRVALRCSNRGWVDVTVPFGAFKAWHIREDAGSGVYTDLHLAEGPGMIKLSGKTWDLHNPSGKEFTWELKEFRRGE